MGRNYIGNAAAVFFIFPSIGYAVFFIGTSLKLHQLAYSGTVIGVTYAAFHISSMIGSLFIPRALYNYYRHFLIASVLALVLAGASVACTTSWVVILLLFSIIGLLYSALAPALTYAMTHARNDLKQIVIALTIPQNFGWCLGFLVGAVSCYIFKNLNMAFIVASLSALPALLFAKPIIKILNTVTRRENKISQTRDYRSYRKLLLLFYSSILLGFFASSIFFTALPPLLSILGLSNFEIYIARFVGAALATLSYVITIEVMLKNLKKVLVRVSQSMFIRGLMFITFLIAYIEHAHIIVFITTIIVLSVIGIAWSYLNTGIKIVTLCFGEEAHRILGTVNFLISLGFITGSVVSGILLDLCRSSIPTISGILALAAAGLYLITSHELTKSKLITC